MQRPRRWIFFAFAVLGSTIAAAQSADTDGLTADQKAKVLADLKAVAPLVRASKPIAENYALCPLERGRSRDTAAAFGSWLAGGEPEDMDCSFAVKECWEACEADVDWACRNLANVAEDYSSGIGEDIDRRLYAQGCALGNALACTNRAAGIVNDKQGPEIDPVEPLDDEARAQCTIIMYENACAADDYWGCSQVAIERGEDGPPSIRDEDKASVASKKACVIDAKKEGHDPSQC